MYFQNTIVLAALTVAFASAAAIKRAPEASAIFTITDFTASSTPHGDEGYVNFNVSGYGNTPAQAFPTVSCSGLGLGYQSLPTNVSAECTGGNGVSFQFNDSPEGYYLDVAHAYQVENDGTWFIAIDGGKHYFTSDEIVHNPGTVPTGAYVYIVDPDFDIEVPGNTSK